MRPQKKKKGDIGKNLERVLKTPASFEFFVAIHDFVEEVESRMPLPSVVLPAKYAHLKQVYQGLEDVYAKSKDDLGHERYMVIQDLLRIQEAETTDSNPIWKKRELLRSLSAEVYEVLSSAS